MTTDSLDYAYLAGLLDGEGSVCCSDSAQGIYLAVVIGMCKREPLDWTAEKFGGKVYSLKEGYTFQWVAPASARKAILEVLLPFLKVKREQAELGIAFCDTVRSRSDRSSPLSLQEQLTKRMIVDRLQVLNGTAIGMSSEARRHTKDAVR